MSFPPSPRVRADSSPPAPPNEHDRAAEEYEAAFVAAAEDYEVAVLALFHAERAMQSAQARAQEALRVLNQAIIKRGGLG